MAESAPEGPTESEVQAVAWSDVPRIAWLLTRALAADPSQRFFLPCPGLCEILLYEGVLREAADSRAKAGLAQSACGRSAAAWMLPGRSKPSWIGRVLTITAPIGFLLQVAIVPHRLPRLWRFTQWMLKERPKEPHAYLVALGTHADWRRRGLASGVVRAMLRECDREGHPAFLFASTPENVRFYEGMGFEVASRHEIPGGPRVCAMLREARGGEASC